MDLRRLKPNPRSLSAFAVGGAWFFIVVSLLHVMWAIGVMWGDPAGPTKLYHTVVGEVSYDAWGLTYTGVVGLVFAIMQLLVVSSAAVTSALPFDRTLRARRASHLVLCGWSALWALNLVRLAVIDFRLDSVAQAALLSVLFGCTVWRASCGWSPVRPSTPTAEPPAGEPFRAEPAASAISPAFAAAAADKPADKPADVPAAGVDKQSFSALVAVALNRLVHFVQTAVQWVLGALQRIRRGGRIAPKTGE